MENCITQYHCEKSWTVLRPPLRLSGLSEKPVHRAHMWDEDASNRPSKYCQYDKSTLCVFLFLKPFNELCHWNQREECERSHTDALIFAGTETKEMQPSEKFSGFKYTWLCYVKRPIFGLHRMGEMQIDRVSWAKWETKKFPRLASFTHYQSPSSGPLPSFIQEVKVIKIHIY